MKNNLFILLAIIAISFIFLGSYFKKKDAEIQMILAKGTVFQKEAIDLAEVNKWIMSDPKTFLEQLDNVQQAEEKLLNIEANIKGVFNTTVSDINKDTKGLLSLSVISKIPRDDIETLLKLFKLTVENGYVDFKSVTVGEKDVITNFDLIKFYKGSM